jgi:transposase
LDWDFPGLQTAVDTNAHFTIDGVQRSGWTVELAFPWAGMGWLANGRAIPPADGDQWRMFIGRYQQVPVGGVDHTVGWAWDSIGSADNHLPERFTPIRFSHTYLEDRTH